MNPGGGPERDDTGLPPVEVEIPDDARELDRDVQAYRRELRALRRRSRSLRLHGVFGRDGMVMPLLICCLVFALITGTLLTLFTSTSINQGPLSAAARHRTGTSPPPSAAAPAVRSAPPIVREALISVHGGATSPVSTLIRAIVLVAPAGCRCGATISQLALIASQAGEQVYLIAAPGAQSGQPGPGIEPANDVTGVLTGVRYQHSGLTAIAVSASSAVSYQSGLQPGSNLKAIIDRA